VWEGFIILDDPSVHVMGHGARTPAVFMVLDLSLELCAFLLKLELCFLKLLVLGFQLFHPHARWGRYLPLSLIVEVVRRGSLLLVDAFDVSLWFTCHKTFTRGVMTPLARVRARGRL